MSKIVGNMTNLLIFVTVRCIICDRTHKRNRILKDESDKRRSRRRAPAVLADTRKSRTRARMAKIRLGALVLAAFGRGGRSGAAAVIVCITAGIAAAIAGFAAAAGKTGKAHDERQYKR